MRPALLLVGLVLACGDRGPARAEHAAVRVVSLHDVTTELVVALGATDRLVGLDEPVDPSSGVAAGVAGVPRVASLESILAARPDLVLGMHSLTYEDPELLTALRKAGIEVYLGE